MNDITINLTVEKRNDLECFKKNNSIKKYRCFDDPIKIYSNQFKKSLSNY